MNVGGVDFFITTRVTGANSPWNKVTGKDHIKHDTKCHYTFQVGFHGNYIIIISMFQKRTLEWV